MASWTSRPMTSPEAPACVDLHLHTTASDGALSPREMVRRAKQAGMELIAITDHDGTGGLAEALAEGRACGIQVLPGIELSCGHAEEVHILGYGFSLKDETLGAFLEGQRKNREKRTLEMLEKLADMGLPIAPERVRRDETGFMGRLQIADAMTEAGYVTSAGEAFDRYLGDGKSAFVRRERVAVSEAIALLSSIGAVVSLAHPGRLHMDAQTLLHLLPGWVNAGLSGIEAYHSSHDEAACRRYDRIARARGLLVTGGSDSHGRPGGPQAGDHLRYWRNAQADTQALMANIENRTEN